MTMTAPMVTIHVLQMLLESYVTIEIPYHYPVIIDSCSEFNDFLKALCAL